MRRGISMMSLGALGLLAAHSAGAQSPARPKIGVLLGVTSANVTDANFDGLDAGVGGSVNSKRRTGFQFGAYLTQPLSGALSLQPELHYIQKGTKLEFDLDDAGFPSDGTNGSNIAGSATLKLTYLEVPVLLRYDAGAGGPQSTGVRPFVVAGPSFAYRIGCSLGVELSGFSANQECDAPVDGSTTDAEDQFRKFDVGGIVGAGLQTTMSGRALSAQLRYSRGFVNIAKDGGDRSPMNTGLSILFGIGF